MVSTCQFKLNVSRLAGAAAGSEGRELSTGQLDWSCLAWPRVAVASTLDKIRLIAEMEEGRLPVVRACPSISWSQLERSLLEA